MKRAGILLMALLYTVTAMGVAVNFHYCFNQVASVKINGPVKRCTPLQANKAMKCCKDKQLNIKVKDGHQAAANLVFSGGHFVADLPRATCFDLAGDLAFSIRHTFNYHGPPGLLNGQPPIYLTTRNFRI